MKIGIIGLGRVYKHYEKNFIQSLLNDKHSLYLFDSNKSKFNSLDISYNHKRVLSIDEIINEKIDFAIIATPSGSHYEITKELLNNGINVLTEKPATMMENELNELIHIAKKSSLKYGVIFQNRLNPAIKVAKSLVDNNYLGDIKICSFKLHWCRFQNYYDDEWHGTWKMDGGVINQQAIHHLDAMHWINGPFSSVIASASNQINKLEAEDTMMALVKFQSGSVGTIEASTAIRPSDKEASIFISGTFGFIKVGGIALNKIEDFNLSKLDQSTEVLLSKASLNVDSGYGTSHKEVIYDFIEAIQLDREPVIPASSSIETVRSVHSLYKSVETNSWINVEKNISSSRLGK